jgi:hypothetical protein
VSRLPTLCSNSHIQRVFGNKMVVQAVRVDEWL